MLNVKKLFTKILGHVIFEQGTDGDWTYRKYADGTAECWGNQSATVTLATVATYYHRGVCSLSLPTGLFSSAPTGISISLTRGLWYGLSSMTASSIGIYVFDVTNSTNLQIVASMHLVGKWN